MSLNVIDMIGATDGSTLPCATYAIQLSGSVAKLKIDTLWEFVSTSILSVTPAYRTHSEGTLALVFGSTLLRRGTRCGDYGIVSGSAVVVRCRTRDDDNVSVEPAVLPPSRTSATATPTLLGHVAASGGSQQPSPSAVPSRYGSSADLASVAVGAPAAHPLSKLPPANRPRAGSISNVRSSSTEASFNTNTTPCEVAGGNVESVGSDRSPNRPLADASDSTASPQPRLVPAGRPRALTSSPAVPPRAPSRRSSGEAAQTVVVPVVPVPPVAVSGSDDLQTAAASTQPQTVSPAAVTASEAAPLLPTAPSPLVIPDAVSPPPRPAARPRALTASPSPLPPRALPRRASASALRQESTLSVGAPVNANGAVDGIPSTVADMDAGGGTAWTLESTRDSGLRHAGGSTPTSKNGATDVATSHTEPTTLSQPTVADDGGAGGRSAEAERHGVSRWETQLAAFEAIERELLEATEDVWLTWVTTMHTGSLPFTVTSTEMSLRSAIVTVETNSRTDLLVLRENGTAVTTISDLETAARGALQFDEDHQWECISALFKEATERSEVIAQENSTRIELTHVQRTTAAHIQLEAALASISEAEVVTRGTLKFDEAHQWECNSALLTEATGRSEVIAQENSTRIELTHVQRTTAAHIQLEAVLAAICEVEAATRTELCSDEESQKRQIIDEASASHRSANDMELKRAAERELRARLADEERRRQVAEDLLVEMEESRRQPSAVWSSAPSQEEAGDISETGNDASLVEALRQRIADEHEKKRAIQEALRQRAADEERRRLEAEDTLRRKAEEAAASHLTAQIELSRLMEREARRLDFELLRLLSDEEQFRSIILSECEQSIRAAYATLRAEEEGLRRHALELELQRQREEDAAKLQSALDEAHRLREVESILETKEREISAAREVTETLLQARLADEERLQAEERRRREEDEERARQHAEEMLKQRTTEETLRRTAAEETLLRKCLEEELRRRTSELRSKALEEELRREAAEVELHRRAAEEEIRRQHALEELQRQTENEEARRKQLEVELTQLSATEAELRHRLCEEASRRAAAEAELQERTSYEESRHRAVEEELRQLASAEAARRQATEAELAAKVLEEAELRQQLAFDAAVLQLLEDEHASRRDTELDELQSRLLIDDEQLRREAQMREIFRVQAEAQTHLIAVECGERVRIESQESSAIQVLVRDASRSLEGAIRDTHERLKKEAEIERAEEEERWNMAAQLIAEAEIARQAAALESSDSNIVEALKNPEPGSAEPTLDQAQLTVTEHTSLRTSTLRARAASSTASPAPSQRAATPRNRATTLISDPKAISPAQQRLEKLKELSRARIVGGKPVTPARNATRHLSPATLTRSSSATRTAALKETLRCLKKRLSELSACDTIDRDIEACLLSTRLSRNDVERMRRAVEDFDASRDPLASAQSKLDALRRQEGHLQESVQRLLRHITRGRQSTAQAVFGLHRLVELSEAITAPQADIEKAQVSWEIPSKDRLAVPRSGDNSERTGEVGTQAEAGASSLGGLLWRAVDDAYHVGEAFADGCLSQFVAASSSYAAVVQEECDVRSRVRHCVDSEGLLRVEQSVEMRRAQRHHLHQMEALLTQKRLLHQQLRSDAIVLRRKGIHVLDDGTVIAAVDEDHRDPYTPHGANGIVTAGTAGSHGAAGPAVPLSSSVRTIKIPMTSGQQHSVSAVEMGGGEGDALTTELNGLHQKLTAVRAALRDARNAFEAALETQRQRQGSFIDRRRCLELELSQLRSHRNAQQSEHERLRKRYDLVAIRRSGMDPPGDQNAIGLDTPRRRRSGEAHTPAGVGGTPKIVSCDRSPVATLGPTIASIAREEDDTDASPFRLRNQPIRRPEMA